MSMKKMVLPIISLSCLFAVSCAHSVTYTEIRKATPDKKAADRITVYEIGDPVKAEYIELGTVWLGESGFSQSCGYNDALYLARQKAREVGADAVQVTRVEQPNWWTTCYRVEVRLLELKQGGRRPDHSISTIP